MVVDRLNPPILYGVQLRWNGSNLVGVQVIGLWVADVVLARTMRAVGLDVDKVHVIML